MDAETKKIVDLFSGRALNFVVVLKEIENVNETTSGLDISSSVDKNEKYRKGIVVSMGDLCPKEPIVIFGITIPFIKKSKVKLGNTVIYDKYKANPLTRDAIEWTTLYYSDLVLID
jgi:co-chaperonin GroES (HSP10)